jgi:hypothetical protein
MSMTEARVPDRGSRWRSPRVLMGIGAALIVLIGGAVAIVMTASGDDTNHVRPAASGLGSLDRPSGRGAADGVTLNGGVGVTVPPNWVLADNNDDFVVLATDGALLRVSSKPTDPVDSPNERLNAFVDELKADDVQDVHGEIITVDPPSAAVVLAAGYKFTGKVVTDKATEAVEGYAEVWLTENGWAVSFNYVNRVGQTESLAADYEAVYGALVGSLAQSQ